jgi:hypothetical protein
MANENKKTLDKIDQFILILENIPKYKNCFNPFNSDNKKRDMLRKNNLKLYLTRMKEINPNIIIIGEAPGYLGIPFSGVPLSSENIIINNEHFLYGTSKGYCRISECKKPIYEKTANTIWNILLNYKYIEQNTPLLWNAFPLHPHKPGNLLSNRTPSKHEIDNLSYVLKFLLNDLFPNINKVIALGRKAESIMKKFDNNYDYLYIRHPSHGGQKKCKAQFEEYFKLIN